MRETTYRYTVHVRTVGQGTLCFLGPKKGGGVQCLLSNGNFVVIFAIFMSMLKSPMSKTEYTQPYVLPVNAINCGYLYSANIREQPMRRYGAGYYAS